MTRLAHCGEDFARAIEDKQVGFFTPPSRVSTGGWNPPVDSDTGPPNLPLRPLW